MSEDKCYKVRDNEGKYLSFDFEASTGRMRPLWGGIAMSYPFTLEEGKRLACLFKAHVVPESEYSADLKAALEKMFGKRR